MMEILRSFIMQIVGAAMISTAALGITPDGRVKKVVELVCGFMMAAVFLNTVLDFDYIYFAQNLTRYRMDGEALAGNISEENDRLLRLIIEEESQAYILDKGADIGIENFDVKISAEWSEDGYWYPAHAEIASDADTAAKERLMRIMESELGIPPEKQSWSTYDEDEHG